MPLKITDYSDAILRDITCEVAKGEHRIILGDNGAGKTTLARVLCGLIPSDHVDIDGINPSGSFGTARARKINYIPAKLEVFDTFLSVEALLALSHFNTALSIQSVLEMLQITHLRQQPCSRLSAGESQLVLTASALLHGADYTLFDEPTANLDPLRMRELFTLLRHDTHLATKLIITHNLDLAYQLGFDVIYLKEGRIVFDGSSDAFFDQAHLDALYGGSVQKHNGHVVVAL